MQKTMTIHLYDVTAVKMEGGEFVERQEVSPYNKTDMVIKSIQSDYMKEGFVATGAKIRESRRITLNLDELYPQGVVIKNEGGKE